MKSNETNLSKKTADLIKSTTKPCPKCGERISKIEGCDQMWCVTCHTAFSWRTGKIDTGRVHNPHFFEHVNENGQMIRNPGDQVCGGLPQWWNMQENVRVMFQLQPTLWTQEFIKQDNQKYESDARLEHPKYDSLEDSYNLRDLELHDSLGYKTLGIGHLCQPEDPEYDWEVGTKVSEEVVSMYFEDDFKKHLAETIHVFGTDEAFYNLPEDIQRVLVNMCFNLGATRLSKFKNMLAACRSYNWQEMARQMEDSRWFGQVGRRSIELQKMVLECCST